MLSVFFNAANCYWASKSATTMFRALPGIMSPLTASVYPGSSFSVSFFPATDDSRQIGPQPNCTLLISCIVFVFRNECRPIVCNSASLSLRERGMYENVHSDNNNNNNNINKNNNNSGSVERIQRTKDDPHLLSGIKTRITAANKFNLSQL